MKITTEGKWQTRDGRPVRILCVDRGGTNSPVIGLVYYDNYDHVHEWSYEGRARVDGRHEPIQGLDLIPAKPEPVVEWGLLIDGDKFMPGTSRMVAEDALSRGSYGPAARLAKRTTTTEIIEP